MQKGYRINQTIPILPVEVQYAGVLIFKTNIQTQGDKFYIKPFLDKHPLITQWNIDLEDTDCVLRIVTTHLEPHDMINLLSKRGYFCEELE